MKKLLVISVLVAAMAALSSRAEDAKAIYEKECTKCHGPDGKGDTKMGKKLNVKDYTDAKVQAELKDEAAMKAIKEGLKDGDKTLMKPAEGLSDADIKALVAYMRAFKK
jgi:cytochrome c6